MDWSHTTPLTHNWSEPDHNTADLCSLASSRPQEGTLTAARGRSAHRHITAEIVELCEMIWEHARRTQNCHAGTACILFKDLFRLYNRISGNVSRPLGNGLR